MNLIAEAETLGSESAAPIVLGLDLLPAEGVAGPPPGVGELELRRFAAAEFRQAVDRREVPRHEVDGKIDVVRREIGDAARQLLRADASVFHMLDVRLRDRDSGQAAERRREIRVGGGHVRPTPCGAADARHAANPVHGGQGDRPRQRSAACRLTWR